METTIKVSNREIAIRAFDYLRHDRKTDSALRLAPPTCCTMTAYRSA